MYCARLKPQDNVASSIENKSMSAYGEHLNILKCLKTVLHEINRTSIFCDFIFALKRSLYMQAAYWNIKVHKDDKQKTAFIPNMVYSSITASHLVYVIVRVIQLVLQGLTWLACLAFLDDILVLGSDFQDHITKLGNVLSRFKKFNLYLKSKKCHFFQKQVKFLGKIVITSTLFLEWSHIVNR